MPLHLCTMMSWSRGGCCVADESCERASPSFICFMKVEMDESSWIHLILGDETASEPPTKQVLSQLLIVICPLVRNGVETLFFQSLSVLTSILAGLSCSWKYYWEKKGLSFFLLMTLIFGYFHTTTPTSGLPYIHKLYIVLQRLLVFIALSFFINASTFLLFFLSLLFL